MKCNILMNIIFYYLVFIVIVEESIETQLKDEKGG